MENPCLKNAIDRYFHAKAGEIPAALDFPSPSLLSEKIVATLPFFLFFLSFLSPSPLPSPLSIVSLLSPPPPPLRRKRGFDEGLEALCLVEPSPFN